MGWTMSIYKNAIDSIQIGVEDSQSKDRRRVISSVRHISAGILLLYKERLRELSPAYDQELLIKNDLRPEINEHNTVVFRSFGKKTVDVNSIKTRFKSLGIGVEWKRFDRVNEIRNNLEHYYTDEPADKVREVISDAFVLITEFIQSELERDPKVELGNECWSTMLKVKEVYDNALSLCQESWLNVDLKYDIVKECIHEIACRTCDSSLVKVLDEGGADYPEIDLECDSCGEEFVLEKVIPDLIASHFSYDMYRSHKDGDVPPYLNCPECDCGTFVIEEDCCVLCGYSKEYDSCDRCGTSLTVDEQDLGGYCNYCSYMYEKHMREE